GNPRACTHVAALECRGFRARTGCRAGGLRRGAASHARTWTRRDLHRQPAAFRFDVDRTTARRAPEGRSFRRIARPAAGAGGRITPARTTLSGLGRVDDR